MGEDCGRAGWGGFGVTWELKGGSLAAARRRRFPGVGESEGKVTLSKDGQVALAAGPDV